MSFWKQRVILITGAGSGIGKALACHFAALKAHLILTDIDAASLAATVELVGPQVRLSQVADVSSAEDWQKLVVRIRQANQRVDVLINNAGVLASDFFEDMPAEHFDWVMNVNLKGVTLGVSAMLPLLEQSRNAMIVNVSSIFGVIGAPKMSAYNASKFAVRGFTEALRQEFRVSGKAIDVVCVMPGGIRTNIVTRSKSSVSDKHALAQHLNKMAMTTPEKAATLIACGMKRRKSRILVGPDAVFLDLLQRLLPSHYHRIFNPLFLDKSVFGR